jgi:hypothetical protein
MKTYRVSKGTEVMLVPIDDMSLPPLDRRFRMYTFKNDVLIPEDKLNRNGDLFWFTTTFAGPGDLHGQQFFVSVFEELVEEDA